MSRINRRKFLKYAVAAPLSIYLPISHANSHSNSLIGLIRELEGDVFINKNVANISSQIQPGDILSVAHSGKLIFSMGEDSYLLQGGSSMAVEAHQSSIISGLRILTGGLLAVFGKRKKATSIYTSTATIGIRGTAVYLNSHPEKLYFCTCYGDTDLHFGHNHQKIHATHHTAFMISGRSDQTMEMAAMQVIDHSDEELRLLEQYSGRKPAFDL